MTEELIDLTAIEPGSSQKLSLHIAKLPSGTVVDMHIFIYKGMEPGPVLLLSGGLHGDEVNGIEIIRRMMENNSIHPLAGTIITVPILNIYGFLNFARELPDGKDANRSFPGTRNGSLASRVAYYVTKMLLPHIDHGIDFHTGGGNRSNFAQVRCDFEDENSLHIARAFAPPFIINSAPIPGSLRNEASRLGKSLIVFEGGQSLRLDEEAIGFATKGVHRLMCQLGMLAGEIQPTPYEPVHIRRTTWIRAENAGLFHSTITEGQYLEVNQHIGMISDPYNEYQVPIISPVNAYVIGLNHSPVINAGDALVHLGLEDKS